MKDKLVKRRNHIDWKEVLMDLEDYEMNGYYYLLKGQHPHCSDNRLAYWTFLHFYDKKILDAYRLSGCKNLFL